jgi:ribulose-phosphate 3-epimerase
MNKPVRVVPAILTDDPVKLKSMLSLAETYTDYVQIDIMDGKFVPSHSITWEHILNIQTNLKWEVHLMVEQPEQQLGNYQRAGASKVIFHYETAPSPDHVISLARRLKLGIGMALNPETPVSAILPFTDYVDSVLFLSVNPGFYGAQFISDVLHKIQELRRLRPELNIGIDGGIKDTNIAQISRTGVNEIFVGSAILLQADPAASYRNLLSLARRSQENL